MLWLVDYLLRDRVNYIILNYWSLIRINLQLTFINKCRPFHWNYFHYAGVSLAIKTIPSSWLIYSPIHPSTTSSCSRRRRSNTLRDINPQAAAEASATFTYPRVITRHGWHWDCKWLYFAACSHPLRHYLNHLNHRPLLSSVCPSPLELQSHPRNRP